MARLMASISHDRDLLEHKAPRLFQMEIAAFIVVHNIAIKELLNKEFGRCRKSQQIFTNLKTFFSGTG